MENTFGLSREAWNHTINSGQYWVLDPQSNNLQIQSEEPPKEDQGRIRKAMQSLVNYWLGPHGPSAFCAAANNFLAGKFGTHESPIHIFLNIQDIYDRVAGNVDSSSFPSPSEELSQSGTKRKRELRIFPFKKTLH